ncbi:hypothetical protein D3C85_1727370 [compost metagenome]
MPSRSNTLCFLMWVTTNRSPDGPPFWPGSPSPDRRMRSPSSTPAGIFTFSVLCVFTWPAPWHLWHGSVICLPLPWQVGQVCWMEKKPWLMRTWP